MLFLHIMQSQFLVQFFHLLFQSILVQKRKGVVTQHCVGWDYYHWKVVLFLSTNSHTHTASLSFFSVKGQLNHDWCRENCSQTTFFAPQEKWEWEFELDRGKAGKEARFLFITTSIVTQGCRGGVLRWLKPPPQDFELMCTSSYRKILPKFTIIEKQERVSSYKQCYTYKNQSSNIWIWLSLCATNSILEVKTPRSSKATPL